MYSIGVHTTPWSGFGKKEWLLFLITILFLQSTFSSFHYYRMQSIGISIKRQCPQLHWESPIPKGISQRLLSSWRNTEIFRICLHLLLLPDLANGLKLMRQNGRKHIPGLGKHFVSKRPDVQHEAWFYIPGTQIKGQKHCESLQSLYQRQKDPYVLLASQTKAAGSVTDPVSIK